MGLIELWARQTTKGANHMTNTKPLFNVGKYVSPNYAYTILITLYAAGLHTGEIASRMQACVSTADYITQLERASK
jgi:hypothetical protein